MLAPSLATMLVVLTTDAVVDAAGPRAGAEGGDRRQLRAGRLRRLPVDQRHGARAGQRRQRGHAERRGVHRGAHRGGDRPRDAAARRRRGVDEGHRDHRPQRRQRGRRADRRPGLRPQQPAQDGAVRQRPQLGPGAGGDRHHRRRVRGRPGRRDDQRRHGLPGRRDRRPAGRRRPHRPGRSPSTSTCSAGAEQATIWTNDLSIAYVHENSAYST